PRAVARALDGELARVDAVDLAHADADRGAAGGEQDRVRLDGAARAPGELEVGEGLLVGGGTRGELPLQGGAELPVDRLHEQSARDAAELRLPVAESLGEFEQPQVGLAREHLERAGLEA